MGRFLWRSIGGRPERPEVWREGRWEVCHEIVARSSVLDAPPALIFREDPGFAERKASVGALLCCSFAISESICG